MSAGERGDEEASLGIFEEWHTGGETLRWQSTNPANNGVELSVFTRRCGTPGKPALVCVHGFPTSSVDWYALAGELGAEFEIFVLDFPGYGLSDKPPAPHEYSLYDDAHLLVHAITDVWKLAEYVMIVHDRGSSVGMIALDMLTAGGWALPREFFVTNGNIFLPLANLTAFQSAILNPETAADVVAVTTPDLLAAGLGATTFMPRRGVDDPEIAALRACFAHNDGIGVLPATVKYLNERASDEIGWLEALSASAVNTTLVWGLHDTIAPLRVPTHVWLTYLQHKQGRNRFWILPSADHYPQCDAPRQLADVIRATVADGTIGLTTLGDAPDGAVLVDYSEP